MAEPLTTKIYRRPDAGRFRHTVDLLKPPKELDRRGQPTGKWEPCFESVKAEIVPLVGRQIELARALYNEASLRISFRFTGSITPRFRIRLAATGQLYHIGHVQNVMYERAITECLCSEVT